MQYKMAPFLACILFLAGGCQTQAEKKQAKVDILKLGDTYYEQKNYRVAYSYYKKGIPFIANQIQGSSNGSYSASTKFRLESNDMPLEDKLGLITRDPSGEESFYKAMDCLVLLGKYNYVVTQYERYLTFFPNYPSMDKVVKNIKFIISQYEVLGYEKGKIRGYRLLLGIDRFNRDGRQAYFNIADYYFSNGNYPESAIYYETIEMYFFADKRISEVFFRLGICNFRQFRGIYYDYSKLKTSEKYFNKFLALETDEKKRAPAETFLQSIKEKQAEKLFFMGKFYMRRGKLEASRSYFKEIIKDYRDTSWTVHSIKMLRSFPVPEQVSGEKEQKTVSLEVKKEPAPPENTELEGKSPEGKMEPEKVDNPPVQQEPVGE